MPRNVSASVVDDEPSSPAQAATRGLANGAATSANSSTASPPAAPAPTPPELIGVQQLGNVGLLAAGLAHDLNNLLTVILGSAELARDHTPASSGAAPHLRTIELTVRRAGELCRAMLACARADQQQSEWIDANTLVRDTVVLLQTSRLAFHRVRLDLAEGLPQLLVRPAQLRQIVLNLLVNAAEACGARGGRIRISTTAVQLEPRVVRTLRPGGATPGRFLRLRVADDGCGMDETTMQQLFTPYFSRKPQGRGLGLAALLEITRTHRGGVRVFSEPDRGSIFDVFVPLGGEAVTTKSATPSAAVKAAPLHGHILLADDEEILRHSLSAFLGAQGLTVTDVSDGQEVLQYFTDHAAPDVLLLDLIMPKLGGLEALASLRASGHHMPVVLMTGNATLDLAEKLAGFAPVEVIAKPFSLADLTQLIAALLPARS